jgi:hypothetical protein
MNVMEENIKLFKQRESLVMDESHFVTEEENILENFNEA